MSGTVHVSTADFLPPATPLSDGAAGTCFAVVVVVVLVVEVLVVEVLVVVVLVLVLLGLVAVLDVAAVGAVARQSVNLEPDLDALVLVLHRLGVDVPAAVVSSGAGPEGGRAVVGEVAVHDVEAAVGFGPNVALLLRGWGSQDAAAVLAVPDA